MEICYTIAALNQYLTQFKTSNKAIGFVPTMGALHKGHISLIEQAVNQNDIVVCSIFVNPIQFNNVTDYEKYPKTIDKDVQMLEQANCTVVFVPENNEIYPKLPDTKYDFGMLDKVMEAQYRPGHFNGVAIVVKRLFDIVKADKAYFGLKDYQQLQVVKKLCDIENIDIEIVPCNIIREKDGLAMSSRNMRLNIEERQAATVISICLHYAKSQYPKVQVEDLKKQLIAQINQTPFMRVEYVEFADAATLQPIQDKSQSASPMLFIAAYCGEVRLIDNMELF